MISQRNSRFVDYSRALRSHKLVLLVPSLVLAIATAGALREVPSLYQSKVTLIVTPMQGDAAPELAGRLRIFRQQLTSRETLEALISERKLPSEPLEVMLSQMRERILIERAEGRFSQPEAFTIAYRATDPETAQKVTDELAGRLLAFNLKEPSSSTPIPEVLRKRAAEISIQLRELERKNPWLISARSDPSADTSTQTARSSAPAVDAMRAQQMSLESLKDQQYKIQQQLADVERRISSQRQIVEQQQKVSNLRDNPTYALLIAKRTEFQGQRDTLINRQELTDKHPRVLAINDQIDAINREIEALRRQDSSTVVQSAEARELAALESERNRLKIELEVAAREQARRAITAPVQPAAPARTSARSDVIASRLALEYFSLKRSYKEATDNLQDSEAGLKLTEGANSGRLRVLEPANLPARPVSPNRPLFIAVAAAVGLVIGAVFAGFAGSARAKSLQDDRDVEHYSRLPLLVVLPRTTTATERRRDRLRGWTRFAFATAFSAVATLALAKILILSDILALLAKN